MTHEFLLCTDSLLPQMIRLHKNKSTCSFFTIIVYYLIACITHLWYVCIFHLKVWTMNYSFCSWRDDSTRRHTLLLIVGLLGLVISDPFGQTHSLASSEYLVFYLFCLLDFEKWRRTNVRHVRKQWSLLWVGRVDQLIVCLLGLVISFNYFSSSAFLTADVTFRVFHLLDMEFSKCIQGFVKMSNKGQMLLAIL